MTLGIMTLSIEGLFVTFSVMALSITLRHNADCHYSECRVLFIVMLSVVPPSGKLQQYCFTAMGEGIQLCGLQESILKIFYDCIL